MPQPARCEGASDARRVAVDANVVISFFLDRNAAQHTAARTLIHRAEDGEISAIVPQAVVFEVAHVLQRQYAVTGDRLATVIKGVTSFPGTQVGRVPLEKRARNLARSALRAG